MNQRDASHIAGLVRRYANSPHIARYSVEREWADKPLRNFNYWANDRPCEGAFLTRSADGHALWLLFIDWRQRREYYVVLLPENRSRLLAELRSDNESDREGILRWEYRPTDRDGRNRERKRYFEKYYGDTGTAISVPQQIDQVADFLSDLFDLAECRAKADDLAEDTPDIRGGFPEGRALERLHRERERNSEVTRRAKAEALLKHGKLQCQLCDFDFKRVYGLVGEGYIEAHHTKPVSELREAGETKIEDIALVCSNCHSMLHRRRPWLGMTELRNLLS